ncbi:MAG: hypothetical protein ABL958_15800, partial [Bdellovibrionia bacterium]
MRNKFLLTSVASLLITLTGCAQWQNAGQSQGGGPATLPVTQNPPDKPVVATCEIDTTDYQLDTHILGYEFVDEFNFKFGFNLIDGFFKVLEVEIPLKKAQLVMSMNLLKPMNLDRPVGSAVEKAYDLSLIFKVKIDFGQILINPEFYYQTPLFNLTNKALETTLNVVSEQAKPNMTPWNSWVALRPAFDEVVLDAGSLAGVQKGDTFRIYNVEHLWTGQPCASDYLMARKTTKDPIAVAQAVQVTEQHALLRLVPPYNKQDNLDIKVGAWVEVNNLATGANETAREPLKKNLRIGKFESEKLVIKDKGSLDLVPLMVQQLKPIVMNSGYVLKLR